MKSQLDIVATSHSLLCTILSTHYFLALSPWMPATDLPLSLSVTAAKVRTEDSYLHASHTLTFLYFSPLI